LVAIVPPLIDEKQRKENELRPKNGRFNPKRLSCVPVPFNVFTTLAQNLVEKKIRVNCVAPGPVWTPLNIADKEAEKAAEHGKETPMERPAQPEEVAPAFVFFASEADSSYITGEVLTLLGGETTAA
jgi:hypothetical protein